jgi:hypothetical protein
VICSGRKAVDKGGRLAWIELSLDPTSPTKISVGQRRWERTNSTLEDLLEVIDEVA